MKIKGLNLLPIIFAGAIAIIQSISEQKEQQKIEKMEERIEKLENDKIES